MGNVASDRTKRLLANTLRKLLEEKNFSKITISELVERAGINRKTFYYHFRSTEALLGWMFETEILSVAAKFNLKDDFVQAVDFVTNYIEQNQTILKSVSASIGRGTVHKFLYNNIYPSIMATLGQFPGFGSLDQQAKSFIAEFYTEGTVGMLQNWIEYPGSYNREEIIEHASNLLEGVKLRLEI